MTTKIDSFEINGIIDTSQNVFGNVQKMCEAAGATFSHDPATGKYSVVILGEDDPIATFNDTNMLGSVILNTTDISEMYNAVSVEYAHKDLKDKRDVMHFKLDLEDTYTPLEVENRLNLSFDLVNNPIQAAYLGKIALQQTRFDRIINFRANYDYIGLSAGDVIQVVNTALGLEEDVVNPGSNTYSKWRIVTVEEVDDDILGLAVNITALEYNTTVYSKNNLYREIRDQNTGIGPKRENVCLTTADNEAFLVLTETAKANGLSLFTDKDSSRYTLDLRGAAVELPDATGVVINFTFPDGEDLDIRCRLLAPNVGMTGTVDTDSDGTIYEIESYLGYSIAFSFSGTSEWPVGASEPYIQWGGDNTGVGNESILVDIDKVLTDFPSQRYVIVECRGNWYGLRGTKPTKLEATLYKGGTFAVNGFTFENTGYENARFLAGVDTFVDSNNGIYQGVPVGGGGIAGATVLGDLMGYFVYDNQEGVGQFVNNLGGIDYSGIQL